MGKVVDGKEGGGGPESGRTGAGKNRGQRGRGGHGDGAMDIGGVGEEGRGRGGEGGGGVFFQAEDGIRDRLVTGVQTCALPIFRIVWGNFLPLKLIKPALGHYKVKSGIIIS